ncbi:MAG: hypothetical protein GDA56_30525 [Hormoscilla sp. GM7CHS1pb]|nr:hypothetical protein [Hormoscilla sp. GM7CHS1pb]
MGSLLILGDPASARAEGTNSGTLEANTAYKAYADDTCTDPTAYIKFTFQDPAFEEIYPIQDGWVLYFNTPLAENQTGTWESVGDCTLTVDPVGAPLQLLSGFKTEEEAINNTSGHFVVGKDYYSAIPTTMTPSSKDDYTYELLGSLTAIGGDNFPALGGVAIAELTIKPNAIRAPHWHLQFAEVGYCYEGLGQVGVIVPANTIPKAEGGFYEDRIVEEMFIKTGEVFLFPESSQHYLRNIGNEDFKCTLFFTEGPPLNRDQLLTITLQNIVGNTPLGVLGPVLVTDSDIMYTDERVSASPAQTYTSVAQGPDVIEVIETCGGEAPDYYHQGCSSPPEDSPDNAILRAIYSRLEP